MAQHKSLWEIFQKLCAQSSKWSLLIKLKHFSSINNARLSEKPTARSQSHSKGWCNRQKSWSDFKAIKKKVTYVCCLPDSVQRRSHMLWKISLSDSSVCGPVGQKTGSSYFYIRSWNKKTLFIADNETAFHSGAKKLQELFTEMTPQVFQCVR